jgi:hypothetical protein
MGVLELSDVTNGVLLFNCFIAHAACGLGFGV